MKLKRLTIERLPGIDRTLEVEFPGDRVALIIGPNASGKSSLIRALKTLLERKPKADDVQIQAVFEDQGRRIDGRATGSARSWLIDGEAGERPDWPETDLLDAYLIRADELIDPDQSEPAIARALKQLLSGGIDLDAMLEQAPFKPLAKPMGLKRKLDDANQAIRTLEMEYAQITSDVDALERLQDQSRAAAQAGQRLSRLDRAQQWLATRHEISLIESRLAELPDGLDRLSGREGDTLAQLQQDQDEQQARLQRDQRSLDQARTALDELRIDDLERYQRWRSDLDTLQQKLKQSGQRLQDLQQQRSAAEARRDQAARRCGGADPAAIQHLNADQIDDLQRCITAVVDHQSRLRDLDQAIARRTEQAVDPERIKRTDRAVGLLREWLALPPARWPAWTLWLLILAATAGASWWFYSQQQVNLAWIAAAAGLMPFSHLIQLGLRAMRSRRILQAWPLQPLEQGRLDDVRDLLQSLEQQQARHQSLINAQAEAEALMQQRNEAADRLEASQNRLDARASDAALDPQQLMELGLSLRLQNLHDWQQADSALDQLDKQIRFIKTTRGNLISTTQRCLSQLLPEQPLTFEPDVLDGLVKQVDDRLNRANTGLAETSALDKAIAQTRADLDRLEQRRNELMANAGLDQDQQPELHQRLDYLEEYRDLTDRLRSLKHSAGQHAQALDGDAELVALVEQQDAAALDELKRTLHASADQRDAIQQQISSIEHAHADAMRERELEQRIADRERLRQQLLDQLNAHRLASAGQFLIERIRDEQHQQHQPELLKRATHWFSRFTRRRYTLNFDGQHFSAMDQKQGQRRSLAALSTATRIQLKLALRLAWIDQLDQHRPALPIFLDEVLATSDPARYQAVVEAAQTLIEAGRQVVYLSAQHDDAQAWRHWAGDPQPVVIPIGDLSVEQPYDFALPESESIPPAALAADEWARQAGVAAIQPWQPPSSIDAFHLLRDDLDRLVDLRQRGIQTLGQLEHALELGIVNDQDHLLDRCRAARAWLQRWRRGQTAPVDLDVLIRSEQVSDTYLQSVVAVNDQVEGKGRALIDALRNSEQRVAGFGPMRIDALEEWLSDHGYLAETTPAETYELINAIEQASEWDAAQAKRSHQMLQAGLNLD